MLHTKRRFLILIVVIMGAVVAVSSILIARAFNLGVNEQQPLYFTKYYQSEFEYNNGSATMTLDFDVQTIDDYSVANITVGDQSYAFNYTHDGSFIDPTTMDITDNNSLFWINIFTGPATDLEILTGSTYPIFDPIGILGNPNSSYTATITGYIVYWPTEAALHGAQASIMIEIRDSNGILKAKGLIDRTCGMLFTLEIGSMNYSSLKLINTNYDISRNRISALLPIILLPIISTAVVFIYLYVFKENESKEDLIDTTFLTALGGVTLLVDFYIDIWYYAPFGIYGNVLIHSVILVACAIFSLLRHYKLKWLIPAFLEIPFFTVMYLAVGDPYVPHLTAFMGLLISWLILLWLSGYKRQKNKNLLGKIVSNIV